MILSTQVYLHFHPCTVHPRWVPHTTKLCWPTISPSTSDPSHFTDNLMGKTAFSCLPPVFQMGNKTQEPES